jgi:hypothetical protein
MADKIIFTHDLERPIVWPTGDIKKLEFREPTARDIVRCGQPVRHEGAEMDIVFDTPRMHAMIAELSGQIPPVIDRLTTNDWQIIAWALAPFFIPMKREPSSTAA